MPSWDINTMCSSGILKINWGKKYKCFTYDYSCLKIHERNNMRWVTERNRHQSKGGRTSKEDWEKMRSFKWCGKLDVCCDKAKKEGCFKKISNVRPETINS